MIWRRWVDFCQGTEPALGLALVRILVPLVIIGDLLRVWSLGLVPYLFRTEEHGGMSEFHDPQAWIAEMAPWMGEATFVVVLVCMLMAATGVLTRPAILVGVLAYAQLGHLFPPGDRAIDRILRTVLLIVLFSGVHRHVGLLGRSLGGEVRRGGRWLIRWFLTIVYLCAGFGKLGVTMHWLGWAKWPPLYRIMADPMAGKLDPLFWSEHTWLFALGGWATIAIELSSPLLLTRFAPYWGLFGAAMHLGIAATMELGMFSWGMLALYPAVLAPWIHARAARRHA